MKELDRYILRQHLEAFAFFVLIFSGVIWLTQVVRLIDTVVASGQGVSTFLLFSSLVLPQVFVIVLPLSAIGAGLYALNKLYTDSELVVMMSAGMGPVSLLRPITVFGTIVAVSMAIVLMVLVPVAGRTLADKTDAIRSDLAGALLVERQFLHPASGLTLFITDTSQTGEMSGIFLDDKRNPEQPVTYSAERALFLRNGNQARLVMIDGLALAEGRAGKELNTIRFDQFVFDLSELLETSKTRTPRPAEYSVPELLNPDSAMLDTKYGMGDYISEGHYKISLPLLTVVYPMIALVTFLAGGYRRSGFGRRVVVAVGVCILIQILMFVAESRVQDNPSFWPLMYAPQVIGLLYVMTLIYVLNRQRSPIRRATA